MAKKKNNNINKNNKSCRDCFLFIKVHEGTDGTIVAVECSQLGYHRAFSVYQKCKFFTR